MDRTFFNGAALAALLAASAAASPLLAPPAHAEETRRAFDIKEQALSSAIVEFSRQSDVVVTASSDLTRNKRSSALQGAMTPDEALARLLRGTGLTARPTGGRTYTLSPSDDPDRSDRSTSVDEVVVTAQKREERIQDIPLSIAVASGEDLDKSSTSGISDTLSRVPGVSVTVPGQTGGTQITLRGVTSGLHIFTGSTTVGYYLDQAPFALIRNAIVPDTSAYDLERVEVLRGPQGTLYGASALNGVVRVLSHPAELDSFSAKARGSVSTTEGAGKASYRTDAAVNIPLIPGVLAARGVVGYQYASGWIDKPNEPNANDTRNFVGRLRLDARPTERLTLSGTAWISRIDQGAIPVSDENRKYPTLLTEPITTDFDTFGFTARYDFDGFSVSSMTSALDYAVQSFLDLSPALGRLNRLETSIDSKLFAQEVVAESTHDGATQWLVGGIYRKAEDRLYQQSLPYFAPTIAPTEYTDGSESYAVYGQVTHKLFDGRLELTGGVRYFRDDAFMEEHSRQDGRPVLARKSDNYEAVTPKASITWHPSTDWTLYATYSQGFRSGLQQDSLLMALEPTLKAVKPDRLINYEVGAKGDALDGLIGIDLSLYYLHWKEPQQRFTVLFNGVGRNALTNASSASGPGVDLLVTVKPTRRLSIGAALGWNDLKFNDDVLAASGGRLITLFPKGSRLNASPEWTVSSFFDLTVPISDALAVEASGSANYTSKRLERNINGLFVSDELFYLNARLALVAQEKWSLSIFGDNLTNNYGTVTARPAINPVGFTRPRPRTIGTQLEVFF